MNKKSIKEHISLWVDIDDLKECKNHLENAGCNNQSEYICKAIKFYNENKLSEAVIESIMTETKPENIKITFNEDKLKKYFPKGYTKQQVEDTIFKLLENMYRKKQREMER